MLKWFQPPACSEHGLHRILSSYWLAHIYLLKKSAKVLLYFGLDCGMMEFVSFELQSKEQLISLPHFWSTVWWKRLRFEHMQTLIRPRRRIRGLFAWSGSNIQNRYKKKRLMSFSRPIQWYHSHGDPIWPDGTFKLRMALSFPTFSPLK